MKLTCSCGATCETQSAGSAWDLSEQRKDRAQWMRDHAPHGSTRACSAPESDERVEVEGQDTSGPEDGSERRTSVEELEQRLQDVILICDNALTRHPASTPVARNWIISIRAFADGSRTE